MEKVKYRSWIRYNFMQSMENYLMGSWFVGIPGTQLKHFLSGVYEIDNF